MKIKTFGQRLKARRKALGISAEKLANKVGIARTYISKMENLNFIPMPKILTKLAHHLGVPKTTFINDALRAKLHNSAIFSIFQTDMTNFELFRLMQTRSYAQDAIVVLPKGKTRDAYIKRFRRCDAALSKFCEKINDSYQIIMYDA